MYRIDTTMTLSFILMLISAGALPLLAVLALLLRRNLFSGAWKILFLLIGLSLLIYVVFDTFSEHGSELRGYDLLVGGIASVITISILIRFGHSHTHNKEEGGAKGIVISEAFHSLIDGAIIGSTYLVSPILGYAATVGIISHELPKIVGTLTVFRGLGLSIKKTIVYGVLAQIGSPVAATLVFLLGKSISHEQFQSLEIASVSSLAAIVFWIIYLEIRYHTKHDHHHNHKH